MTELNPYAAPAAALEQPTQTGTGLDDAMAGKYDFGISEVMREAWQATSGFKASFWGAAAATWGVVMALSMVNTFITPRVIGASASLIGSFVIGVLFYPVFVGVMMMAVRRAAGLPVTFGTAFNYFDRAGSALLAGLLVTVLMYVGMILLIIPGIYLAVAYYMTIPLLGDRELSAWQAMEVSRKAVSKRWFRVAGLFLVTMVLITLSALPLGIGLVWTLPWGLLVMGVLYKRMFGVASAA